MSTRTRPDAGDAEDDALRAEIDAELAAERRSVRRAGPRTVGTVLLAGGIIGWIAAVTLLIDKLYLLENPGASLGCDINPFISCGTVMMTWQASALGLPNMAIGLAGFAVMAATGALQLSGTALPRWYRWATLGGMTFAFAFVHFLAVSAMFVLRTLCPWCLVVWTVTAPMFFATLAGMIEDRRLRLPAPLAGVLRHWVLLTLAWYALVVLVIAIQFGSRFLVWWGLA